VKKQLGSLAFKPSKALLMKFGVVCESGVRATSV
jgi:hypothetical protein